MFALRLITPEPTRRPFIREGLDFYARRLRAFSDFTLHELRTPPLRESGRGANEESRRHLTRLVSERLKAGHRVVQFDPAGRLISSEELAGLLGAVRESAPGLDVVLGGALGLGPIPGATQLSLGPWTLPHELARLVVLEGLYRAFTILTGHPYHRGG